MAPITVDGIEGLKEIVGQQIGPSDWREVTQEMINQFAELSGDEEGEIGVHVKKLLNDALQKAEDSPLPDPATLLDGVYATPEDLDTPHHK